MYILSGCDCSNHAQMRVLSLRLYKYGKTPKYWRRPTSPSCLSFPVTCLTWLRGCHCSHHIQMYINFTYDLEILTILLDTAQFRNLKPFKKLKPRPNQTWKLLKAKAFKLKAIWTESFKRSSNPNHLNCLPTNRELSSKSLVWQIYYALRKYIKL